MAFLAGAALRTFFAGAAEALVEALEEGAATGAVPADGLAAGALLLDLDAAFFFGDAAFFFELLALADLGLAAALGFGFEAVAVLAFLAAGAARFLVTVEVVDEDAGVVAAGALAALLVLVAGAAFLAGAFFAGDAERLRLLVVDFAFDGDDAVFFFGATDFFAAPGVFDRLRDVEAAGLIVFVAVVFAFFVPAADERLVGVAPDNLKLPLAPTPLVCFNVLFFVPARSADFKC